MQRYQYIISDASALVTAGEVESESFSQAIHLITDHMKVHHAPFKVGDFLSIGVAQFPPVEFQCSGFTDYNGQTIPTWKHFVRT